MRTAIELPDDLLELARRRAASLGVAVDEVIAFPLHHSQSKGTLTADDVRAAMDASVPGPSE